MIADVLNILCDKVDFQTAAYAIPGVIVAVHLMPWLWDTHRIRGYPGPFFAKFSDIWLGYVAKAAHRSETIHEVHRKYGMSPHSTSDLNININLLLAFGVA
jgi:benzoate 4-monooxygenase